MTGHRADKAKGLDNLLLVNIEVISALKVFAGVSLLALVAIFVFAKHRR